MVHHNYDKGNRISSVVHSPTTSSSDDITVSYTYDANGQVTQITDGLSNNWTKAYDALLRNTTITTPSVSGTSYTLTKEYDGNGNITKVTDFKSNANVGAVREPPDRAHRDAPLRPDVHNQRTGIRGMAATAGRPTDDREHAARIEWGGRPCPPSVSTLAYECRGGSQTRPIGRSMRRPYPATTERRPPLPSADCDPTAGVLTPCALS